MQISKEKLRNILFCCHIGYRFKTRCLEYGVVVLGSCKNLNTFKLSIKSWIPDNASCVGFVIPSSAFSLWNFRYRFLHIFTWTFIDRFSNSLHHSLCYPLHPSICEIVGMGLTYLTSILLCHSFCVVSGIGCIGHFYVISLHHSLYEEYGFIFLVGLHLMTSFDEEWVFSLMTVLSYPLQHSLCDSKNVWNFRYGFLHVFAWTFIDRFSGSLHHSLRYSLHPSLCEIVGMDLK